MVYLKASELILVLPEAVLHAVFGLMEAILESQGDHFEALGGERL